MKKGILEDFTKITGKNLYQSLFFDKVACLRAAIFLKKELWHWAPLFSCEFCEISKNTYLTEHLWTAASV